MAKLVPVGPTTSCAPSLSLNLVSTSAADVIARMNRTLLMIWESALQDSRPARPNNDITAFSCSFATFFYLSAQRHL